MKTLIIYQISINKSISYWYFYEKHKTHDYWCPEEVHSEFGKTGSWFGKNIRVRLNGIDTPEIKGKCDKEKYDAEQAREMVGDILKDAEKITLKNMQWGNYFRIASDVIIDGEGLADILIEAGMVVRYDGGKKTHKWCDPINE